MIFHYRFVMAHKSAGPVTSFFALSRSYLKVAYYSGLSPAFYVLQTAALLWNVGYPMHTESPSGFVNASEY